MKLLFVSNLFPDQSESIRGLDNACLLHHLREHVPDIRVIALRPSLSPVDLIRSRRAPREEDAALAPTFLSVPYIPKLGSRWNHRLITRRLRKRFVEIRETWEFDAVLCSWLYPDGCAVAALARELSFPFHLICQGSDAHRYLDIPVRRKLIVDAVRASERTITRSKDLARRLTEAGAPGKKLETIYNGVDTTLFRPPESKPVAREELGLDPDVRWLLFVGNFLPVKDPLLLVEAWRRVCGNLPGEDIRLAMIGAGPMEGAIRAAASDAGLAGRLQLPGRQPPALVADYMRASDLLCLSSRNEGVPNVVLEAFASGLPVVSTDVGGIGEVLNLPELGTLVPHGDPAELAHAIATALSNPPRPDRIAQTGKGYSWSKTVERYHVIVAKASRSTG